MEQEVLEFIHRRFPNDTNNWLNGNCYYFALILQDRFNGRIWYDGVEGHFITKIGVNYYDLLGKVSPEEANLIYWDSMEYVEPNRYKRIVRDCLN